MRDTLVALVLGMYRALCRFTWRSDLAGLPSALHAEWDRAVGFLRNSGFAQISSWTPAQIRWEWDVRVKKEFDSSNPESFYRQWVGQLGAINLLTNVADQFARVELAISMRRHDPGGPYLDYGCGTAALLDWILELDPDRDVYLVDVLNLAQEYVHWKYADRRNVRVLTPDNIGTVQSGTIRALVCVDVLEHLVNSGRVFQDIIVPLMASEGVLWLQAPWGGKPEHIPEARVNWYATESPRLLDTAFERIEAINPFIDWIAVSRVCRKR